MHDADMMNVTWEMVVIDHIGSFAPCHHRPKATAVTSTYGSWKARDRAGMS